MTTTHMHSLTSALTLSCSIALGLVSLACDTSLDAQRDALSAEGDAQLFDDDEAFLEEAFFAGALDTLVAPTQAAASGEAFAAITQQIVLAEQDLAYIEIVTLASNPHPGRGLRDGPERPHAALAVGGRQRARLSARRNDLQAALGHLARHERGLRSRRRL